MCKTQIVRLGKPCILVMLMAAVVLFGYIANADAAGVEVCNVSKDNVTVTASVGTIPLSCASPDDPTYGGVIIKVEW